jgi:hypothetical protein
LPERFAICQLPARASLPEPPAQAPFYCVTRTDEELSIVLPEASAPAQWKADKGWRCLKVLGPLDFGLTGILASLSTTLAEAGVSVFAVSTYDTDYILVKGDALEKAIRALSSRGHVVTGA